MSRIVKIDRRDFLQVSATAAGGLVLGVHVAAGGAEQAAIAGELKPNVFVAIDTEGGVTIWIPRPEMGQGSRTGLTMILADELEARWESIKLIQAPAGPRDVWGSMTAGGSSSIRSFWGPMGDAGAAAREMLIAAAASRWGVSPSTCRADLGTVVHASSGRRLGYGDLVEEAALLPVPEDPPRKDPEEFRYIGKKMARLDIPEKVDGSAVFGIDVRIPGMRFANVRRCPVIGGSLHSFNDTETLRVRGVDRVVEISAGVAVVADSTWAAMKGMEALSIDWDEGPNTGLSSEGIERQLDAAANEEALVAERVGDPETALAGAARTISAVYKVPYISHSPLEPMNATAHVTGDSCEVWVPTQAPQSAQSTAANALGIPRENVLVHTVFSGGAFGRRLSNEFVADAVEVSRAIGGPVQILWTRAEDTQHTAYRPLSHHHLEAAFDDRGNFLSWGHKMVAHSMSGSSNPQRMADRVDSSAMQGVANLPYKWPNALIEWKMSNTPVPVSAWRSVYNSQTWYATEGFLDEVAEAAGRDPLELRLELLEEDPRLQAVLRKAAEGIDWGRTMPDGRGLGIACSYCFGGRVAQAAEVSVDGRGNVQVHRVEAAIDSGWAVSPDAVAAQVEGGIIFALSAALHGEITLERGRVVQETYAEYPIVTMTEAPVVNVHIIDGGPPLGGAGEPPIPAVAPAVANAIYAATGKRVRRLPIRNVDLGDD
jgi:isoquinoline 1-oxidoreductase beta subunit